MTRKAWVFVFVVAACGKGTSSISYEVKTSDTSETGPASFEQVADRKPGIEVIGPEGAYLEGVRAALAGINEAAKVKVNLGTASPGGRTGHLDTGIGIDAVWWELPNVTKAHGDLNLKIQYSNSDAAAVGKQVAEVIVHYLDGRRPKRAAVPALAGPAKAVAVGKSIACSLHADGSVHCWGLQVDPLVGPVPSPTPIKKAVEIAAADRAVCARLEGGEVKCLGMHEQQDTGKGHAVAKVCDLDGPTKIALGVRTGCAIVKDGKVRCWDAESLDSLQPSCGHQSHEIPGLAGATSIAVGFGGMCALVGGKAMCWNNTSPASPPAPAAVPAGTDVLVGFVPCVVEASGKITCVKDKGHDNAFAEAALPSGSKIAFEPMYGCAITPDAKDVCWGAGGDGQLGDGTMDTRKEPRPIFDDAVAVGVAIAGSCVVKKDGTVWCYGQSFAPTGLATPTNKPQQLTIY